MSTAEIMKRIEETSPRVRDKFVGVYYLLTIATGTFVLLSRSSFAVDVIAGIFYIAVTAFLYVLSRPVNGRKRG